MTLVSDYSDDFSGGSVAGSWGAGGGEALSQSGGQLRMVGQFGTVTNDSGDDFTADRTSIKIGAATTANRTVDWIVQSQSTSAQIGVEFATPGSGQTTIQVLYSNDDGSDFCNDFVACIVDDTPWLRFGLSEDGTNAYWDASPDGEDGNWVRIKTFTFANAPGTWTDVLPTFTLFFNATPWTLALDSYNQGSATPGVEPGPADPASSFTDDFEDAAIGDWFTFPSGRTEAGGKLVLLGSGESATVGYAIPNPALDISDDFNYVQLGGVPSGGTFKLLLHDIDNATDIHALVAEAAPDQVTVYARAADGTLEVDSVAYEAPGALDGWLGIRVVGETFTVSTSPDGTTWTPVMAHALGGGFGWDRVQIYATFTHPSGGGEGALLDWNTNGSEPAAESGGFGTLVGGGGGGGGGGGEEPGVPALLRRRAYLAVTIDGETPSTRPVEGWVQMDFRQQATKGGVVLEREPVSWDHDLPVELVMGAGTNDVTRMSGVLWEPGWALYPNRQSLALRGKLAYLERYRATADLSLLALTGAANPTDKQVVQAVLDLVGAQFPLLTYDAANITNSGIPLGTVAPERCVWKRGKTASSYLEDVMRASIGRRLVESLTGTARYIQIVGRPSGVSDHAFTQGVDVFRDATSVRTIRQAANRFEIRGLAPIESVLQTSNPYMPWDPDTETGVQVAFELQSDWVQTQAHADALVDYWEQELNRELVQADYSTARDDSLEPGQRIALDTPKLHVTEPVWLPRVTCAVRGGKFRQRLGVVGGGLPAEPEA